MQNADNIFIRRELTEELGKHLDLMNYNEFKSDTGILAPINLEQVSALEMLRAAGVQHSRDISAGGQTPFCPGTG